MKIIIALACAYYVIIFVCLMTGELYEYKKDFYIDLIPFGAILRKSINGFKNLD